MATYEDGPLASVAVSAGDPGGIGAEITARVLADDAVRRSARFTVIGDVRVVHAGALAAGVSPELFVAGETPTLAPDGPINVLLPEGAAVDSHEWGRTDPEYGRHAARCMELALDPALGFDGLVCAPMNKEAFHLAGYDYPDELAFMADLTHAQGAGILGYVNGLWTTTLSEHVPFAEVREHVRTDRILERIETLREAMTRAGHADPAIAVAALNPHAGEGGQVGREEIDEIAPAIEEARRRGIRATGPVPADMVFVLGSRGDFDGVVSMYHDQANIARKLLGTGCTVYHGLPVLAATTAHGTAFDIAGTGSADEGSLRRAVELVVTMARAGL